MNERRLLPLLFLCMTLCAGCADDAGSTSGPVGEREDLALDSATLDAELTPDILMVDQGQSVDAGCVPRENTEVACDGVDDDCDGVIDEALVQRCYEGPGGTLGNGLCLAGDQVCEGGEWGTCSDQILPAAELCNAFDDDCDGEIDEGLYALCGEGAVDGVGECRPSARLCSDGAFGECVEAIEPVDEVCDGLDNDCDGSSDEGFQDGDLDGIADCVDDDFDNDGVSNDRDNCPFVSNGTQRDTDADEQGDLCDDDDDGDGFADTDDCGPLDGTRFPGSVETCNGLDDDCDGEVDELAQRPCFGADESLLGVGLCTAGVQGCVDGMWSACVDAVLPALEICDGQDQDCDGEVDEGLVPGWPDQDGDGFGDDASMPVCPAPQNFVTRAGDCDDGDPLVFPGATDLPDEAYVDSNCDGIDGTIEDMIFVDTYFRNHPGEELGTPEAPFFTLRKASTAANERGIKIIALGQAINVGATYDLKASLYGGYDSENGWYRGEIERSILAGDYQDVPVNIGLSYENVDHEITIARVNLFAGTRSEDGQSSYGVLVKNAPALTIIDAEIGVADGGDGLNGTLGDTGLDGGAGGRGSECDGDRSGGVGGVSMCGNGGRGGRAGEGSNSDGSVGEPTDCGGSAGSGVGFATGGSGGNGRAGTNGGWGTVGPPAPEPHPTAEGWFTGFGGRAGTGNSGTGGCGGGGGGGSLTYWYASGGGGGGGGGAGCGGQGGTGGGDGGASIGVYVANVPQVTLRNVFVRTNDAGFGGPGGTGGEGGRGGNGGEATAGNDWPCNVVAGPGKGGAGGKGGDGGRGGDGIGGRGGWTVGVACFESALQLTDVSIVLGEPGIPFGTNEWGQQRETVGCGL